jgi:hypothetical protein
MPNHITNRLTIKAKNPARLQEVLDGIKGEPNGENDEHLIDFNRIAPIPEELKGTSSPTRIITQDEYDEQEKRIANGDIPEIQKLYGVSRSLTQALSNQYKKDFGYDNWYDWQINNWGTKWNAYSIRKISENIIEFDTAWSTPVDVMEKLSKKFSDVEFQIEYADEDFGYNVGRYNLLNGEDVDSYIPEGNSEEALMMALDISGNDYYLSSDFFNDRDDEEFNNFENNIIKLIHEKGRLDDDYPAPVLLKLKELALADEQFERIIEIDKLLSKVEITE